MRKYILLLLMFNFGCRHAEIKNDYEGIWINKNLDYLHINADTLRLADAFAPISYYSKYIIENDTLVADGNNVFCRFQDQCSLKFFIHNENGKTAIYPKYQMTNSHHFFSSDDYFLPEKERMILQPWDSIIIKRSELTSSGVSTVSTIFINNFGEIYVKTKDGVKKYNSIPYWKYLNEELTKIHGNQFKIWNEGEIADGDYINLNIYRNGKKEMFYGSIIPFYFQNLRKLLNDLESKRLQNF